RCRQPCRRKCRVPWPCIPPVAKIDTSLPPHLQPARQWTRLRPSRFRLRNLSSDHFERRSNDLEIAGDQAVVTTMAQHVELPPRRYPWGRPESKYIESPASSAYSWPSMWTFSRPLSV